MKTKSIIFVDKKIKPPRRWAKELDFVLITEKELSTRVKQIAKTLQRDFAQGDLVIVALLSGTVMFLADLIRLIELPLRLDFIGVSSYRDGTESKKLILTKDLHLDVKGREVLIVDDILDTGRTLKMVLKKIQKLRPRSLKTCVLLDKPSRRSEDIYADYVGFQIPNYFVVGYGMDYSEKFRNLPFIGVLKPEVYLTQK